MRRIPWLVGLPVFLFISSARAQAILDPGLREWVVAKSGPARRVIVVLKSTESMTFVQTIESTAQAQTALIRNLQSGTKAAFGQVQSDLKELALTDTRDLWLIRGVCGTASPQTVEQLIRNPLIYGVFSNTEIRLSEPRRGGQEAPDAFTYGLRNIRVPEIRTEHAELTGGGFLAGILDTGIDPDHPDLKGRLIRFRDFANKNRDPYDDHGHGTHVAGTIAGGDTSGTSIGVAPKAKLLVGKIFTSEGGSTAEVILEGMQWMADPDGKPETRNDVPGVVNNSWGGEGAGNVKDPFYIATAMWRRLNIVPVFAAGNDGPQPMTISPTGSFPISLTVGAVDIKDTIAEFSSVGPGRFFDGKKMKEMDKPDVVAPGVGVYSSLPGGKYESWSGTSMATPHVTGAVVLLRQAFPALKADMIIAKLAGTAVKPADKPEAAGEYDYQYGKGRIDLVEALKAYKGYVASVSAHR